MNKQMKMTKKENEYTNKRMNEWMSERVKEKELMGKDFLTSN